jgi:predicted permease
MRMSSLLRRRRVERDLDKEFRFHLDQQIAENVAKGMDADTARYHALRSLGGLTKLQEECRDMRRTAYIDNFFQDLRYAARALKRAPGFTAVIILTLALSIGADSAIFSVIDGVLLRPLPYQNSGRLVRLFLHNADYPKFPINPNDFRDYRARNHSFESMAAYTRVEEQLSGRGEAERLTAFAASAGYLRVLGVRPELGREFDTKDELPGASHSVIISDRLWRNRFAANRSVLGQTILLNSVPFTVVGVVPAGVEHPGNKYHPLGYGEPVDAWLPFTFEGNPANRGSHYLEVVGRLRANVTPPQAQAELSSIMAQLAREHPGDAGWTVLVIGLQEEIVARSERMLLVLLGAVGLVLLIACANAANLLLARATARQREIAVRAALGAGTGRLLRQMLTESLLIAFLGAAFGLLLAIGGVRLLVSFLPVNFPRAGDIHINLTVFTFTLLLSLGTGLLFGLAPALQLSRVAPGSGLSESGARGASAGRRHVRLRGVLVICEVSLACVLLVGAGLLLRSFVNLLRSDYGFFPEHVLTASISLPNVTYRDAAANARFYDRMVAKLQAVPGVEVVGTGTDLPWTGYDDNLGGFLIEGKQPPPHQDFHARYHAASSDYFRALGIPLIGGRFFADYDSPQSHNVLIINQRMARLYWGRENPVGHRISFTDKPKESDWVTIVGLVGDVKDTPNSAAAEAAFWWPIAQTLAPFQDMSIVIRSNGDAGLLAEELRRTVRQMDPSIAVADVRLLNTIASASFSAPRFALFLIMLFAGLALALAAVGTYGVISYSVSQRSREFGVRIALGAQPRDVLGIVLGEGMRLAFWGILAGLAAGAILSRVLDSLLYQVASVDAPTLIAVGLTTLAIAVLACWIPARRATCTEPVVALRAD